jgi:hypothetical protein
LVLGSKPNLAQAHEFGAVFVGIDVERKGYWVYWPMKRRVSVQQNVTFVPSTVVVTDGVQAEWEYAVH